MGSLVSDNRTFSRQSNSLNFVYPNDFRRDKGGDLHLAYAYVSVSVSGSVCDSWTKAEAIRWRSGSLVSITTSYCLGPTMECACGAIYIFVFSMRCAPYIVWLPWSFLVDGRIQILKRASGVTPLSAPKNDKQTILPLREGDSSRLLGLVTETSDSRSSACEQIAVTPTTAP